MAAGPQAARPRKIGVVTGLASEREVAEELLADSALEAEIVCAGASTQRAAALSRGLVTAGCQALLSFGIAGALAPDLDCGDLIVADEVLLDKADNGDLFSCDRHWLDAFHTALGQSLLPYRNGLLIGSSSLWRDAKDKQAVHEITEAIAIDMESGAVGAVAAEAGLPFLAVRAVADRAGDSLPALVESAVKSDGRPDVGRALAALLRRPGDIPATIRLARQSELALARLRMLDDVKEVLFGRF